MSTTPNMGMTLPTVGIAGTPGPTWATDLNDAFDIVDAHDHTSGKGSNIPFTALTISQNPDMNGYDVINTRSYRMNQASALFTATADKQCSYVYNGEFYYRDASGNNVQITSGGNVLVSAGNISGLTAPAAVSYAGGIFTFVQDVNKPANMSTGYVDVHEAVTSGKRVRLQALTGLSSDLTVTLFSALPATELPVVISSTGVMSSRSIVNADVNASAAIAYSKLNLAGNIVNADVGASAAIAYSKLNLSNSIVNADIKTTAAIAYSKLDLAGSVKDSDRAAVNIQSAYQTTYQSITLSSFVDITDLSISLTTVGRPVFIAIVPTVSDSSYIANTLPSELIIGFFDGATQLSSHVYEDTQEYPANIFTISTLTSGAHTIKVRAKKRTGSGGTAIISECKLIAYEL